MASKQQQDPNKDQVSETTSKETGVIHYDFAALTKESESDSVAVNSQSTLDKSASVDCVNSQALAKEGTNKPETNNFSLDELSFVIHDIDIDLPSQNTRSRAKQRKQVSVDQNDNIVINVVNSPRGNQTDASEALSLVAVHSRKTADLPMTTQHVTFSFQDKPASEDMQVDQNGTSKSDKDKDTEKADDQDRNDYVV
jgi:hypothetical protein